MKVKVGDQVVFPRCGVGEVEALVTMPVGDEQVELRWCRLVLALQAL